MFVFLILPILTPIYSNALYILLVFLFLPNLTVLYILFLRSSISDGEGGGNCLFVGFTFFNIVSVACDVIASD